MSDATLFYICGGVLAAAAVLTSFIGLRFEKFPGRYSAVVFLCFAALIGASTTYAVLNGQEEAEHRAHELEQAGEEFEHEEELPSAAGEEAEEAEPAHEPQAGGGVTTIALAASPTALAFDKTELQSKPGEVTIDLSNPSAIEHDVAIEQDGKELAVSETIVEGTTSVSADLAPGDYTFLCTVPGHAPAGMEGTLTVR